MPEGDCQHSGTYNGHPVMVAAALAAVRAYLEPGFYEHLFAIADRLYSGINAIFQRHDVPGRAIGLGARFGIYFGVAEQPQDFRDALEHSRKWMLRFICRGEGARRLFSRLRRSGVPPRILCGDDSGRCQ